MSRDLKWWRRSQYRNAVAYVAKGLLAALGSYVIAAEMLDSVVPAFAPFAALLVIQMTVYRSLLDSLRYVAAVVAGVTCAGVIGQLLHHSLWALAILVSATLLLGLWRRLGSYGAQATTVGLFAFAAGGGDQAGYLLNLLFTILLGAVIGVIANMVGETRPRLIDVEKSVESVSRTMQSLLADMARRLRSDDPLSRAEDWRKRSLQLVELVEQASSEIDVDAENTRFVPPQLHHGTPVFAPHRSALETLHRAARHLRSVTRALAFADRDEADLLSWFLPKYADVLDDVANVTRALDVSEPNNESKRDALAWVLDAAFDRHRALADELGDKTGGATSITDAGALLVEAERMLAEFQFALDRSPS